MTHPTHYFGDASREQALEGVYLDHNATTPLEPRVCAAMVEWLTSEFGNPSSIHRFGQRARAVVENARAQVAALIGARPVEIVFTGSGTEANNAVIAAVARRACSEDRGRHLVLTAIEHPSVLQAARRLEQDQGFEVTEIPPDRSGVVRAEDLAAALRPDTALVVVMRANNELGTLQPVREIAAVCGDRGVPVLCDAVQAVGKIPVSVDELGVDYLTLAGHKFHGPLGAAALWIRSGAFFEPMLLGGSQERRRRASTENVTALLGLGVASEIAAAELEGRTAHLTGLRELFERGLGAIPDLEVQCARSPRLPNTSCVTARGVDAATLSMRLDLRGFAVSTGAACASGTVEPSRTLVALGLGEDDALSTLRVSFGVTNEAREVDALLPVLADAISVLREGAVAAAGQAAAGAPVS